MRRIKNLIMFFCLLAQWSSSCYAQDKIPGIIVEMNNGQKIEYKLADNPKLAFDGTTITLTTNEITVEYKPTDLKKVTTGDVQNDNTGVHDLEQDVTQGTIQAEGGFVRLSGFTPNEPVRIYSLSGVLTTAYSIPDAGTLIISISSLPTGISIIKTNNQSIKITKR